MTRISPAVATTSPSHRCGASRWVADQETAGSAYIRFASTAPATAPAAVGGYIGAAYWFTSSTSFANPAVTLGRAFSDTFAGIAPGSVPMFVLMQLLGGVLAIGLVRVLHPDVRGVPDSPRVSTTGVSGE